MVSRADCTYFLQGRMSRLKIFTDGGARGNPGPAAIGIVIKNETSGTSTSMGMYIGIATNNIAEYKALIEALKSANDLKAENVVCNLDSELVVKQLTGAYKVKEPHLARLWLEAKQLEKTLVHVEYKYIPREYNKEADKLVNKVLDSQKPENAKRTVQRTLV